MTVGSRIKELREKRGFTQNRLEEYFSNVPDTSASRRAWRSRYNGRSSDSYMRCARHFAQRIFFDPKEESDMNSAMSRLSANQKKLLIEFLNSL